MRYNKTFYKNIDSELIKCYVGKSYKQLVYENYNLNIKLNNIYKLLNNSIYGINEKLRNYNLKPYDDQYYLNDYQIVRLKGIRTKCNEILDKYFGGYSGNHL